MFRCAKDVIRPPLQNFPNEAKYSGVIFIICDPICLKMYYNVKWLHKTIYNIVKFGRVFVTIDINLYPANVEKTVSS